MLRKLFATGKNADVFSFDEEQRRLHRKICTFWLFSQGDTWQKILPSNQPNSVGLIILTNTKSVFILLVRLSESINHFVAKFMQNLNVYLWIWMFCTLTGKCNCYCHSTDPKDPSILLLICTQCLLLLYFSSPHLSTVPAPSLLRICPQCLLLLSSSSVHSACSSNTLYLYCTITFCSFPHLPFICNQSLLRWNSSSIHPPTA